MLPFVIDTLPFWAALARDAGNDAGAVQEAMRPLLDAAHEGLSVVVGAHSRKGGGDDGEAVSGSGEWVGAADVILELEKAKKPTQRVLLALSRFPSTPGSLLQQTAHRRARPVRAGIPADAQR